MCKGVCYKWLHRNCREQYFLKSQWAGGGLAGRIHCSLTAAIQGLIVSPHNPSPTHPTKRAFAAGGNFSFQHSKARSFRKHLEKITDSTLLTKLKNKLHSINLFYLTKMDSTFKECNALNTPTHVGETRFVTTFKESTTYNKQGVRLFIA